MRQFVDHLRSLNFHVCGVFLIDAQFLVDASKFASGVLSALSTMVNLEVRRVLLTQWSSSAGLNEQFVVLEYLSSN